MDDAELVGEPRVGNWLHIYVVVEVKLNHCDCTSFSSPTEKHVRTTEGLASFRAVKHRVHKASDGAVCSRQATGVSSEAVKPN